MPLRAEPTKKSLGVKPIGDAKLPSKKALDFLTDGPPAQQRIQQFGRLTPIGRGSPTFGVVAKGTKKGDF